MNPGRLIPHAFGLALAVAAAALVLLGAASEPPLPAPKPSLLTRSASIATTAPQPSGPAELRTPAVDALSAGGKPASASPTAAAELASASPSAPSTARPLPTASQGGLLTPTATLLPDPSTQANEETVFGLSVLGRPLAARRFGTGPMKVVLVGDIHGAYESNTYRLMQQLLEHFGARPAEIPEGVSLWIVPTANPDGQAAGRRWNANGVDLNRNADTDLDGCAGNDWSPDTVGLEGRHPGAGGSYPFSEPETLALRSFLSDAQVVVFYHSAAGAIYADSCRRHQPSLRLAQVLSESTGYPAPRDGWTGYRITGDFSDYLAGEGTASVTVELTNHEETEFGRNLEGVKSLMARVDLIVGAEAEAAGAELVWLDSLVCSWRFADDALVHPIGLQVVGEMLFLLDSGRVLELRPGQGGLLSPCAASGEGAPPALRVLLAAGDSVDGAHVTEPLDLAASPEPSSAASALLVLDRAGDVYRYELASERWSVERRGRRPTDTGDHYYVALAAFEEDRYLLETTHEKVWRFSPGQTGSSWADLPLGRDVDVAVTHDSVYVLTRALGSPIGDLVRFVREEQRGRAAASFEPGTRLMGPRQVAAAASSVFLLDRAGRRLLELEARSGKLNAAYQFSDRRAMTAMSTVPDEVEAASGASLILAGRDRLDFYPGLPAQVGDLPPERKEGASRSLVEVRSNDSAWLESLRGLSMPIAGASITRRDYQMPGSPRHYRQGVHEGIDFYTSTSGVPIDRHTPVRAVAAGKVIRALWDYEPLTKAQAQDWAELVAELGYTPPDILDGYRGMQVWIEHESGLVSRYAHLGAIAPGVLVGASVQRGQVIGMVGNSGTPESVNGRSGEVHLHLELWAGEQYVGQFLRPIEVREWIERILQ